MSREWQQSGRIDLFRFYFRRFKRLTPALSLVIFTTVVLATLFLPPLADYVDVAAMTGAGALILLANGVIAIKTGSYFQPGASTNPFLHTWSLSVEEQFYIFFPALLLGAFILHGRSPRKAIAQFAIAAVALLSACIVWAHLAGTLSPKLDMATGFYSPLSRAWEFAAGALLSFARPIKNRTAGNLLGAVGALLLVASFWFISERDPFPGLITLLPVAGTCALIAAGSGWFNGKLLASPPLVHTGDASYSLYLWHWPLIVFSTNLLGDAAWVRPAAAIFSLIPAILAYRYIETPIRRYEPRGFKSKMALIARTALPTLAACVLLVVANINGYWSKPVQQFRTGADPLHASLGHGCGTGYVPRTFGEARCAFGTAHAGRPIYLIGDSNADHFSEAVIAAGDASGRPVRIFTKGGCSLIGKSWSNETDIALRECQRYVREALDYLDTAPDGWVIIGMSDSTWQDPSAVGDSRATETNDPVKKAALLDHDLVAAIQRIKGAGHAVTLLKPVAKFMRDGKPLFDYSKCTTVNIWLGRCPKTRSLPLDTAVANQAQARRAIDRVAQRTGAAILDTAPAICGGSTCRNIADDGTMLYKDSGHLSVAADKLAEPLFVRFAQETKP